METILHHISNHGSNCLLVFQGESSFRGVLGGAGFRPYTVAMFARLVGKPRLDFTPEVGKVVVRQVGKVVRGLTPVGPTTSNNHANLLSGSKPSPESTSAPGLARISVRDPAWTGRPLGCNCQCQLHALLSNQCTFFAFQAMETPHLYCSLTACGLGTSARCHSIESIGSQSVAKKLLPRGSWGFQWKTRPLH